MKKLIVSLTAVALSSTVLFGKPFSDEVVKRVGGFLDRPDAPKGKLVLVNTQTLVGNKDLQPSVDIIRDVVRVRNIIVTNDVPVTATTAAATVKKHKASLAVFIVDCQACGETILVAPENRWAIVNVAALKEGSKSRAFTVARTNKELLRAFLMLGGAYDSSYKGSLMGAVADVGQLDDVANLSPPLDVVGRLSVNLPKLGIAAQRQVTYRQACQEGWAPAPTNDVQKAIWDKVHALPTNPIKIMPETKPVKE